MTETTSPKGPSIDEIPAGPTRLDLLNVTKACVCCGSAVMTSRAHTPLCMGCRSRGLCVTEDVDAMRAEIDRLKEMAHEAVVDANNAMVDALTRAEKAEGDVDALRAEVERLTRERDCGHDRLTLAGSCGTCAACASARLRHEVERLTRERDEARAKWQHLERREDEYQDAHDLAHKATRHAEKAEADMRGAHASAAQAWAQCAEMRAVLERIGTWDIPHRDPMVPEDEQVRRLALAALATDAGKGWRPPEDVEALRRVAREVTDYLRALDASGSAWSRALRDALAALPERLR